jgi:hypothetical protein
MAKFVKVEDVRLIFLTETCSFLSKFIIPPSVAHIIISNFDDSISICVSFALSREIIPAYEYIF